MGNDQTVMWLMFSVGCGELWVRFRQSNLELELVSRKYLPEDDETVLRAQDLGPLYKKVLPAEGVPISFYSASSSAVFCNFRQAGQWTRPTRC